jgi:hypothetical protein
MRKQFDINLLNSFANENNIEIIGNYEKLNCCSIINGKCKTIDCSGEFSKAFKTLFVNKGFYCKKCLNNIRLKVFTATMIKKYGITTAFHCEEFKNKSKNTCLEKYGVENANQCQKIKDKSKNTCFEKYGVDCNLQLESCKEKIKQTNLIKYGCEYSLQNEEIKNKIKQTNLSKYGFEYSSQSEVIKNKIKQTSLKNYGVENIMQNPKFAEEHFKKCFKSKEYVFPSGRIDKIQGYENYALDFLLKNANICEFDIITGCKNVPVIWYNDETGKKHRHYVDIFIPSQNRMIEVKSIWTSEKKKDCIFLKQAAAKELGYNYEIWVYDGKGNIVNKYL